MVLIKIPPSYSISENLVTTERAYWQRRQFIKTLIGAGIGTALVGCQSKDEKLTALQQTLDQPTLNVAKNKTFAVGDRPITVATHSRQCLAKTRCHTVGTIDPLWL